MLQLTGDKKSQEYEESGFSHPLSLYLYLALALSLSVFLSVSLSLFSCLVSLPLNYFVYHLPYKCFSLVNVLHRILVGKIAAETIENMRTVVSLSLERTRIASYIAALKQPYKLVTLPSLFISISLSLSLFLYLSLPTSLSLRLSASLCFRFRILFMLDTQITDETCPFVWHINGLWRSCHYVYLRCCVYLWCTSHG